MLSPRRGIDSSSARFPHGLAIRPASRSHYPVSAARHPETRLTEQLLLDLAADPTFSRGKEYFLNERVHDLNFRHHHARALVQGSSVYRVHLRYSDGELEAECTCPAADDVEVCKHAVAVGLAWIAAREGQAAATPDPAERSRKLDPFASLSTLSSADLVALIRKWSDELPDLAHRLELYAATQKTSKSDPSALRASIKRTIHSRRFIEYHLMPNFVRRVEAVVEALEQAAPGLSATDLVELVELALAATENVVANADDSNGELSAVLRSLEDLHLRTCARGGLDLEALGERIFRWEMDSDYDVFHDAATKYAQVFGDVGRAAYRRLAEREWASVPALGPGESDPERYGRRFRITHIMQQLAKLDGDLDSQIAVRARDLSDEHGFRSIARMCHETGRDDLALEWIDRGMKAFPRAHHVELEQLAAEVHQRHRRHATALDHQWNAFEIHPTHHAYRELIPYAERADQAQPIRAKALALLQRLAEASTDAGKRRIPYWHPGATDLVAVFLDEGDIDSAWESAHRYGGPIDMWTKLAELRRREHPDQVVAVYERLVEAALDRRNREGYANAVHWLGRIREAAVAMGRSEEFERIQDEVKTRHKAKRNFMKLLAAENWA